VTSFVPDLEKNFEKLSNSLFENLKTGEDLNLNLNAEESTYVRFNKAQVRQNTFVDQRNLTLQFQSNQRKVSFDCTINGELEADRKTMLKLLDRAREEVQVLPEDPYSVAMENRGESRNAHSGQLLTAQEAIQNVIVASQGSDFVGLYASGPVVRATRNSKGQNHWFSSESFFMDYSLFTTNVDGENKAVKGVYAGPKWDQSQFQSRLQNSQNQLSLMKRKSQNIKPGSYRTYLAPGAISEICSMLSWNALSFSSLKKGGCALAKLYDKEKELSKHFSLKENFALGLSPQFNSMGEVSPTELPLIEKGVLKNMLVSSRAEKEYGVKSNGADSGGFGFEALRSPEIQAGQLKEDEILKELQTGLYLSNLHYLNWSDVSHARLTGMTRYACFWVDKGEIVGPIKDLRFDDSLYQIFGEALEGFTKEQHVDPAISTYFQREIGGKQIPGALLGQFAFTL
jgi:predicted Zn-dependent protease